MANLIRFVKNSPKSNILYLVQRRLESSSAVNADGQAVAQTSEKLSNEVEFDTYIDDPWDVLYGVQRFRDILKKKGIEDIPDNEPTRHKANSTPEKPNIIKALGDHRLLGCTCEDEPYKVNYLKIYKGETIACRCGHWFKCVDKEYLDLTDLVRLN